MAKKRASSHNRYHYQNFEWKQFKLGRDPEAPDWRVFLNRIRLEDADGNLITINYQQLLDDFGNHIMGNILWYDKKIIREKTLRLAWILVSLSLLLLIPILVAQIQKYSQSVSAEVTAIFTGFFALYQGVSKWLESRNVIGTYWQTSSNLKSRLYSLEDKWKYTHLENGWTEEKIAELVNDLREAVKFGMDSVKAEKQLFFANYNYPQFNIMNTILGVKSQVGDLLKREGVPEVISREVITSPAKAQNTLAGLTEVADEPTVKRSEEKVTAATVAAKRTGASLAPAILKREDWGARPSKAKSKRGLGQIKSIVIHHAAGYWDGRTSGIRQVQNVQKLHQIDRGWVDIGYHFLVDPEGVIYQGREFKDQSLALADRPEFIQGAHALNYNSGRIGICLLGQYQPGEARYTGKPTPEARKAITELVSFLYQAYQPAGDDKPDIRGRVIAGHRDFKKTSCPGDSVYEWLEALQEEVLKEQQIG